MATLTAISETTCIKISIPQFKDLISENKKFNLLLMQSLASKIRYKALRHSFIQTHSLEENLIQIKNTFPDVFSMIEKNDLANYLGITLRSLNRSLKKIQLK
ncbi:Crp/Fnr family transcriptional regulator [Pedobacter sp. AW31-3R]|uniref:Crp/Fnr family transcriptional regulator n=1 Tax=Pedobacter sp. AW31-3R TaxID=3445781 RepID=UPI003F9FCF05